MVGFGRWFVFSADVGATCVGDAYVTANLLPNVLFEVVAGGALTGAVVPLLAGPLGRGAAGRVDVDRIASALLTWAVAVLLPVAVVVAVAADPLTRLLAGDADCPGQQALTVRMLLVFAPQIVLYGIGVVLVGVLQAHRRFFWPALVPLLSSVVVIVAYRAFAASADGAQDDAEALPASAEAWLTVGTTAGVMAMTLPLLVPVARAGVRLRPSFAFPGGVARRARALAGAGIVALLAQQASVLTTLVLARQLGPGGTLVVFQYAQAVYLLPYAVLAVPLATAAFPRLAERAATGDVRGFAETAARTTRAVLLVAVLGASALAATASAVAALFVAIDAGADGGPASALAAMGPALTALAPGLVGFALVAHVGRALYALERGRLAAGATAGGWVGVVAASVVAVLAVRDTGAVVVALGVGTSAGMTLAAVLLLGALRSAAGREALAGVPRTLLAGLAGGLVGAVAARWLGDRALEAWGTSATAAVGAGLVAGLVVAVVSGAGVALLDRDTVRQVSRYGRARRRVSPEPDTWGTVR